MKTDFLVIGSGAAGLSFALKAAAHGHVTIVTKGEMNECNTNYAQGGICSVTYAPDTFEKHIRDTLVCGAGKCDEAAVELVVKRAPELIRDLIEWGTRFDKTPDGRFELNREGGHTEPRILHHEDLTGAEIERALVESVRRHPGITVLEHHFAIDLLTQHHLGEFVTRHTRGLACFGAYVLNLATNEIETMLAKFTVVATGGSVVYGKEAMRRLHENGLVVYIRLPYEEIERRLSNLATRGVTLKKGQTLRNLYDERIPLYEAEADYTFEPEEGDVQETVLDLAQRLSARMEADNDR